MAGQRRSQPRPYPLRSPNPLAGPLVAAAAPGIACDLRIGVSNDGGEFEAHAWVEYEGVVINDSAGSIGRFAAFDGDLSPMTLKKAFNSVQAH